jgi:hypothetical protein
VADNFTANAGSGGSTFASDDIGGTHWPRVKVAHGADGSATDASLTAPLPVAGIAESNQVAIGGVPVNIKFAAIDTATSGDTTLIAAVTSKKIRVMSCFIVAAGAVNVRFESGTGGTALTGQMNLTTNSGFVLPFNPGGWFETGAGALLNLELSGAVSVDGSLSYIEV